MFGGCKEVAGPVPVESVTVSANSLNLVPGDDDDGLTWRTSSDTVDGIHYSEGVRDWLADQVVSYMLVTVPQ